MGALRALGLLVLVGLAGCGGGDAAPPRLVDGSRAGAAPAALTGLQDAVLTRTTVMPAGEVDRDRLEACGLSPEADDTVVVERIGLHASSLTYSGGGRSLNACDYIPDPAEDPDRPYGGIWCGAAVGRLDGDRLNDPRLDLCTADDGSLTAFAWVEPGPETRWVAVSEGETVEVYQVAAGLPVRVTTTQGIEPEGSASFDVRELASDGSTVRSYALDAGVSG